MVTSFAAPSCGSPGGNGISSFEYDGGVYVTSMASPYTQGTQSSTVAIRNCPLSCALSDRSILTYNVESMKLEHTIPEAHAQPISCVHYLHSSTMLASSGQDGYMRVFDLRNRATSGSSATLSMTLGGREQALALASGFGGTLLAVGGSSGKVYFYDLRKAGQPLGRYENSHTEEVTQLQFQTPSSNLLLTGGEDGLVCVMDTSQPSEDAALKSVLNVSNSVRSLGFFGPNLEGVFCCTGSETLSCWHAESAQRLCDYGGLGLRPHLSSQLASTQQSPSLHNFNNTAKSIDYLVGGVWEEDVMVTNVIGQPPQKGRLTLVTGTNNGDVALYTTHANSISLQRTLTGGHKSVVRDYELIPRGSGKPPILITGGEDARLCQWDLTIDESSNSPNSNLRGYRPSVEISPSRAGGGPAKRIHNKKKLPLAPY